MVDPSTAVPLGADDTRPRRARSIPPVSSHDRRAYGALDLGTNNCRLLIARPADDGFVIIDAFSRIVRLGEGLAGNGRLCDAAVDRAVSALCVCGEKLRRRRVHIARSVATEACRQASNGAQFIERVRHETGIALDIISTEEEARLAMLGCSALLEPGEVPALIFDIGGGSTELILVDTTGPQPRTVNWFSAPWGVVSLTEVEPVDQADEAGRIAAYARMRARVADAFAPFVPHLPAVAADTARLLGTSGTVTTLASVHLQLPSYNRRAVDGLVVPAEAMRGISRQLAALPVAERALLPCIGTERADLVVAGCAILEAILDMFPAERLCVADRGIREGILRTLMARDGHGW
ncbi:Ppx/GppA phosphatase family protein [Sphingomonas flavalba]|uniref:Ppx/GppA phosphatase family protein n=1 Tax=Sphingomonas flavalba TaxID=2559804 RepID=UPI001EF0622A|nr:Ppx/GppA phosphatase family protein [Sphingomonas flavalba]